MKSKVTSLLLSFFFSCLFAGISAQSTVRISAPRLWWGSQPGLITEAVFSVEPQGIYTEIGVYLTFSASNTSYSPSDSLEVEYKFQLPPQAHVHDSWLWIDDIIVRADIWDVWKATQVYEDIVDRRQDPSLLRKLENGHYELRIFPILKNEDRKVKISILMPTQWSAEQVITKLPFEMLTGSALPVKDARIVTWDDSQWPAPSILEYPNQVFSPAYDDDLGNVKQIVLPQAPPYALSFGMQAPLQDGMFLSRHAVGDDQYFQLALLPDQITDIQHSNKTVVLFDREQNTHSTSIEDIFFHIKNQLKFQLSESDSFNLILSQDDIFRLSEHWLPADSTTLENAFASLNSSHLSQTSHLPELLHNAIDFVQSEGQTGQILLIASSNILGDNEEANEAIDDLMTSMSNEIIPIHIVNFQDQNFDYYWIGNIKYAGSGYFFQNITRQTAGNYYDVLTQGLLPSAAIAEAVSDVTALPASFDIHTDLQNGFCFDRYSVFYGGQSQNLNKPFLQVGKMTGDFPFEIEVSGIYQGNIFSETIVREEVDVQVADTLAEESWIGNHILHLEQNQQSNSAIANIVDISIDHRVLSLYTAFIALEPLQGGSICASCLNNTDDEVLVSTKSAFDQAIKIDVFPNPFKNSVNIQLLLNQQFASEIQYISVFDARGTLIRKLKGKTAPNQMTLIWDGLDQNGQSVPPGIYFLIIQTDRGTYSTKLMCAGR